MIGTYEYKIICCEYMIVIPKGIRWNMLGRHDRLSNMEKYMNIIVYDMNIGISKSTHDRNIESI